MPGISTGHCPTQKHHWTIMKKTIITIALLAAFAANAQTANSGAQSGSNSGADSTSGAAISSQNSGNTSAIGNQNASRSDSASQSGASSGSLSGAVGNTVVVDQRGPTSQTLNSTGTSTSNNRTTVDGTTTSNDNVRYSGTVENRASGGYTNTDNQNINYSGTTTVKNVPGIAMSGPASGPCTGASGGLGLAGPGWGLGLNGSAVMADCRLRENTRVIGMAMQSIDGGANPQERGEAMVMFMDALRGLAAYNNQIIGAEVNKAK